MNKNKFLLYLHLLCSFFFFIKEILVTENITLFTIFYSIIYLTMIILPAVFNSRTVKVILYTALLPGIGYVSVFLPEILLLLPLHITGILALFSFSMFIEVVVYIPPVFFISREHQLFYLIFAALIYLVYKIISGYDTRAKAREKKIDALELQNQYLSKKISRLEELDREKEFLIKLEERNRIAQKLHDELGHTITGSLVQLEAVNTIINDQPGKAKKMITNVSGVLNKGMNSIRKGLKSLKPDSARIGLQQVKELLGDFEKNTNIRTHLEIKGNMYIITIHLWHIIIMNLKEALTNVVKHSKASEVFVDIIILNKIIKIRIKDNGQGYTKINPGMGLLGIEERTKEAGGTLILDGSDGFSLIMIFRKGDVHADPYNNSR